RRDVVSRYLPRLRGMAVCATKLRQKGRNNFAVIKIFRYRNPIPPFTHSLIHSFTHSPIPHSLIPHSLIHSFTHSLIDSLTPSPIPPFTHSLIHSFTH